MDNIERFKRGVRALKKAHPTCVLELDWTVTLTVMSACKLSLKHPQMPAGSRATVEAFVEAVVGLVRANNADLAELLGEDGDGVVAVKI